MKKTKGAALLWCLSILVVLSVITLTAVAISVTYYRDCMKHAGDNQADYNAAAAVETLKDQLGSRFGGKQIYFTYEGSSMLDPMNPARALYVSEKDREYFGSVLDSGTEEEKYFVAVRSLENALMDDYIKFRNNNNFKRTPVKFDFNYGRVDTSVYNHGYYGDSADIVIDSIEEVDENNDGRPDYYIATLKAVTTLNTGHTASVGARFKSRSIHFNAENIPAASVCMLQLGISPETIGDFSDELRYKNADGIVLGLDRGDGTSEPCVLAFGDSNYSVNAGYTEASIMSGMGYIKTDGYIIEDKLTNEVSYLDQSSFKLIDGSGSGIFSSYAYNHRSENMVFTEDFVQQRSIDLGESYRHYFDIEKIENGAFGNMAKMKMYYELPDPLISGNRSNNRTKRYFVSNNNGMSAECYYQNGSGTEKEYLMSFSEFADHSKNNTAALDDGSFEDSVSKDENLICCVVERRYINESGNVYINPDNEISLENIVLEDGMNYFFRICQNTRISFSPQCSSVKANVYFQLYNDKECSGGNGYKIDLKLVNPPESINIFAFDYCGGGDSSSVKPSSTYNDQRNVTIIVNNSTPRNYTIGGWFSCYMLSVFDETENVSPVGMQQRKVDLKTVKPPEYISVSEGEDDFGSFISSDEDKNYVWVFDKFVEADG